jgi:hypothetical protein
MLRPADTSPEAWEIYLDIQRRMTPGEKISRVFDRNRMIRKMKEAGLRKKYPAATEREIQLRRIRLELGNELFLRVYGDVLPREDP